MGNDRGFLKEQRGRKVSRIQVERERNGEEKMDVVDPLEGYAESVPAVYCEFFTVNIDDFEGLRDLLGKLWLMNSAALSYELEISGSIGLIYFEGNSAGGRRYNLLFFISTSSGVSYFLGRSPLYTEHQLSF